MASADLLNLLTAFYKDKVQRESLEKLQNACFSLLEADADSRRMKATEDILAMARLQRELEKFRFIYKRVATTVGEMEAIEGFMRDVEHQIRVISNRKNRGLY